MKIAVVGRGNVGGGLAALWTAAGHDVYVFGRDGGDATGCEVVVVAVPSDAIAESLAAMHGLDGQVTIDCTNALADRPESFPSLAHQVKSIVGGPTAKAFNINFAALYPEAAKQRVRPGNLFAADDSARNVTQDLIAAAGYDPIFVGDLDHARSLEDHSALAFAIFQGGLGPYFYRIAAPGAL